MSDNTVVTENDLTSVVEVTSAGPAGPPGGALTIQDEGVDEGLLTDKINFAGSTVSVVNDTEAEIATVTVNAADPGANTNITSLGGITGGISSPDYVQFDTAAAAAGAVGRLLWNDTDGTLEFQLKGGNVTLQIGQEEVIRVTNKAGVTMTDGQAVYITGSTGNHLNVTLAQANAEATSSKTLAVVTETIANNNTGFATSSGLVRGLDTSALTEGAAIWLSPTVPGGLTTTRPTAPDHAVLIGWCVRQHASVGVIYVHIANGYELDELHDVLITAAANNQVLRYDAATGLWKNATISPTLTLTGDVSGSATFTDLGNATLTATVADDSHNHVIANVDGLQDALDAKLPSASYTATDVLDKIKTVDGAGSGLDADLLDGQSSAYYTAINDRLGYTAENAANKGVAGGYASLDGAGLVPSTQLPSYVDDVLEFANLAAFPVTGETGKIYVAVDTSKTYRWSGSTYVEISASPGSTDAVPEGSTNLYFTTARARQSVSAGTGISYNSSTGVITNAAPDQTVAITGSGTTTVTGTYPNFTVSSADQYVGTVTSVSGTGTVNGLTLTGTVTSSGSLTLGGTLSVNLSTATVTGTLPVTKGGTGTATQFTAGSVVFAGTSGVYTQDNANLFWDDTNNRLGIKTATPTAELDVNGTINVPNQLNYDYTTSVLPDVAPALNLNFVQSGVVDPRITFTRSSTATYYDGRTQALAEQNLLTFTQEFDNAAWSKAACTITANSGTAPDGTSTADDVTSTGTDLLSQAATVPSGTTVAYSQYVKRGNHDWVRVGILSGADDVRAWFNIATGVVGTTGTGGAGVAVGASIVNVGNGWYRCTIVGSLPASTSYTCLSASATADAVFTRVASGVRSTWGAQLEQRSTATAYVPTTTAAITRYQPVLVTAAANAPRLDYDPVTLAPNGLLVEEQRTNLLLRSEEFDNASWSKIRATVDPNVATAPDGTLNADKLVEDTTAANSHSAARILGNPLAAGTYTYTTYIKQAGRRYAQIMLIVDPASTNLRYAVVFDLQTGTVTSTATTATPPTSIASTISDAGNGWYRCSVTVGNPSGLRVDALISTSVSTTASVNGQVTNGDGTSGIYIWGAQLEAGSFATSYIPTVASQVTRTADVATITGANFSQFYNQSEGTWVAEGSSFGTVGAPGIVTARSADNAYMLIRRGTGAGAFRIQTPSGVQGDFGTVASSGKTAAAYRVDDYAVSTNGGTVSTDTAGALPSATMLEIGTLNSQFYLNGHIRSIKYFPTRLSNTQLQALSV